MAVFILVGSNQVVAEYLKIEVNWHTIRYDSVCLTCSKKLTGSQLSLPHGTCTGLTVCVNKCADYVAEVLVYKLFNTSYVWQGVMSVESQEPRLMNGLDLRELTFQNVVDSILRPSGIKIGGFPEDLFLNLTEQEHHDMMCNIWYASFSRKWTLTIISH